MLIAGFIRLRGWRLANWLRAAAWAGAWIAGAVLFLLAQAWGDSAGNSVSWGELPICAAWLVLGAAMTWLMAARCPDVSSASSRARGKAS